MSFSTNYQSNNNMSFFVNFVRLRIDCLLLSYSKTNVLINNNCFICNIIISYVLFLLLVTP